MTAPKKRKWLRRLAAVAALCLLLLGLALAALQTPPAKRLITAQINGMLATALPWPGEIEGLGGVLPFAITLESFRLGAEETPWLEIHDAAANIDVLPLFRGQVSIARLAAGEIALHTLPPPGPEEPEEDKPFSLPALPDLPTWIRLGTLDVARLFIGEPVLGQSATYSIQGAYHPEAEVPLHVRLRGLEETQTNLALAGSLRGGGIYVAIDGDDVTLLPALAGVEGPFGVTLSLAGPLSGATLVAKATRAGEPLAALDLEIAYGVPLRVTGTGQVVLPPDLAPTDFTAKTGDVIDLDVDIALDGENTLVIGPSTVQTAHAELTLEGSFSLDSGAIDLRPVLTYDDLRRVLDSPPEGDAEPVVARLPLTGTLAELSIAPAITLGGEDWIGGEIVVGLGETLSARGSLNVAPAFRVASPELAELLEGGGDLDLDVTYAGSRLTINEAVARVGETRLAARGIVDTVAPALDLTVEASAEDLKAFESVAGMPLDGAVRLNFTAQGDSDGTVMDGTLAVESLQAGTLSAPSGTMALAIVAGSFPDGLTDRIETTLDGNFPQLQLQPEMVRDLTLAGVVVVEDLKRLHVTDLDITDGNVELTADGTVDLDSRAADFQSAITIAEIGDYATLADLPYRGAADFTLDVTSGETEGSLIALIDGSLEDLGGLPDELAEVTGTTVTLNARADYDGTSASVRDLAVAGAGISLTGEGSFDLEGQTLEASAEGSMRSIASLSGLAGRSLAGSAAFNVTASGPVDALRADGTLRGTGLDVGVFRAEDSVVKFTVTGIPSAIAADLDGNFEQDGDTLTVKAALGKEASVLRVKSLDVRAGANEIAGDGVFDLDRMRGHGTMVANLPDLAALDRWTDTPLAGSVDVEATLARDTGALSGSLTAQGVVAASVKLGQADGSFSVENLFDSPSGQVNLSAADLDVGDVHLASLDISTSGPPERLEIALKTSGVFQEFTRFNIDVGGQLSGEPLAFELRDLNFGLEDFAFALREPATLSWQDGELLLTPLELSGDSGNLLVAGHYNTDVVDIRAEWNELSMRLVSLAGMNPMAGTLDGSLTVTGPSAAPSVDAEMTLVKFNPEPEDENDFPGLNGEFSATIAGGSMRAELLARVPDKAEFLGETTVPMTFSLAPWTLEIPEGSALSGSLTGHAEMEVLPLLLGLEGHDMHGTLNADLTAAGSRARPDLNGTVTVTNGYYEHGNTSTILNDLEIVLVAAGDTIRLTEFSANDTAGGTVSGEGQMVFDPDRGSPYEFKLMLNDPRIVYRDDLRAQGDGELRLTGDSSGALLEGNLAVAPAYITIPEASEETRVTTVAYTEVGAEGEGEGEEPDEVAELPFAFTLDLALDFPGRVYVTGPALDSEWDGKLTVKNQASNPAIEGVLRVRRGTLEFLGRAFTLADSTITFDGQAPPAPYLRINAVADTGDVQARIRMEGTQDNLNLTLESDPVMPRDEILSRVLFGQRLSDVSPVQALTLARYAPMFRRNVSTRSVLGREGPRPFLVDRISIQSGTQVGEASITTGKYLNDDFYLEFEQGLGSAVSLVSLDWLFAPQWALRGKTTSRGEGGFGVFWKKNY